MVKAVEAAKKKIDPTKLKHDPSKNLEKPPAGYNRNQVEEPGSGDEEDEDDDENKSCNRQIKRIVRRCLTCVHHN